MPCFSATRATEAPERVPVARAAGLLFEVANSAFVLSQLVRAWSERHERPGAGLKNSWRGPRQTGRSSSASFLIVDAQSVKNSDTAGQKGYDAGKRVSGIKRHIAVDTQGLPHAATSPRQVTDRNGALAELDRCSGTLSKVSSILADGGYSGRPFADAVNEMLGASVQIAKRSELDTSP